MEPKGSSPCSQQSASCSYPEEVYVLLIHFLNIHFNISYHLRLDLPSGLFPSGVKTKILCAFPFYHMPHPPHPSSSGHPNNIWWWVQTMEHNSLRNVLQSPVTSTLRGPTPPSTPSASVLPLCKDQLPHQHKTTLFLLSHSRNVTTLSLYLFPRHVASSGCGWRRRPTVMDGGSEILDKQLRTAEKEHIPAWGSGDALKTFHSKTFHSATWRTKSLSGVDPLERRKQHKLDMTLGTWNVRSHTWGQVTEVRWRHSYMGERIHTIKQKSRYWGHWARSNADNIMYMVISHEENAGQNYNITIDNKSLQCVGCSNIWEQTALTNQTRVREDDIRVDSTHSGQNLAFQSAAKI